MSLDIIVQYLVIDLSIRKVIYTSLDWDRYIRDLCNEYDKSVPIISDINIILLFQTYIQESYTISQNIL